MLIIFGEVAGPKTEIAVAKEYFNKLFYIMVLETKNLTEIFIRKIRARVDQN